ncbi:hypothetical protein C8J57DRAFT_1511654 [Mycena rebaudengoi]|nr:hypothetical protein C8J57DRAFT_1511654 [Mycena rebaudengoi]
MAQGTNPETNTHSSSHELHVLLSRVGNLIQMSLDLAKLGVDVQQRIPIVLARHVDDAIEGIPSLVAEQVEAQVAAHIAAGSLTAMAPAQNAEHDILPKFIPGVPITPGALELMHPAGDSDECSYHVLIAAREPGIYLNVDTSNRLVHGVTNAERRSKSSRLEALAYYRVNYEAGKVKKWFDIASASPAEIAAASAAATAAAAGTTAAAATTGGSTSTSIPTAPSAYGLGKVSTLIIPFMNVRS